MINDLIKLARICTGLLLCSSTLIIGPASAQTNPYVQGMNEWLESKQTKNLDDKFPTGGAARSVGQRIIRRAWGLTHPLSEIEQSPHYAYHQSRLAEEIDWVFDVAENYDGRLTAAGSWNVDRFVLRRTIDALVLLDRNGLYPGEMPEWKERLKLPLEYQYRYYYHGPGQDTLPGFNSSAGYYPNSDALYVLLMGAAGQLYDDPRYSERAQDFVDRLDAAVFPDGGLTYQFTSCEIPVYHSINIECLARYFTLTGDSSALDVIRKSENYYPMTYGAQYRADNTSIPWWKRNQGSFNSPGAMDIVAAVANSGENKFFAQLFRHNAGADYTAVDYWTDTIKPVPPRNHFIAVDRNINGIRGWSGRFSWTALLGHDFAKDAFAGAMLTNAKDQGTSLNSELKLVTPEVILDDGTGELLKRAAFATDLGPVKGHMVTGNDFGALAVSYQLHKPVQEEVEGNENEKTPVPWTVHQVWLMTPENITGQVNNSCDAAHVNKGVRTRVRFAPHESLVRVQEDLFSSNGMMMKVFKHNYDTAVIGDAVNTGWGSFPQDQLGDEIFFTETGRSFQQGEAFKLAFTSFPAACAPAGLYQEFRQGRLTGYTAYADSMHFLLVFNPSLEAQDFALDAHSTVDLYNDTSAVPYLRSVQNIEREMAPGELLVLVSDSIIYGNRASDLRIEVRQAGTDSILSGAQVMIGDSVYTTDDEGAVFLDDLSYGFYHIGVSLTKFHDYTLENFDLISDTVIQIYLEERPWEITFRVVDRSTGDPVNRAIITFDEETLVSNTEGTASFRTMENIQVFLSVSNSDYFTYLDTVIVDDDMTLLLPLTAKRASIIFEVSSNGGAMANAVIDVQGLYEAVTNAGGQAFYSDVAARNWYHYTIAEEGFNELSDSLYLETDTVLNIELIALSVSQVNQAHPVIIYPNPAVDELFIRLNDTRYNQSRLRIYGAGGRLLMLQNSIGDNQRIDVSGLQPGVYLVIVSPARGKEVKQILILE